MDTGLLRVEALGPLRAFAGERELVLGPPKQQVVFAALALGANGVVSRDELVDHLWGESPPHTAAGSLHTYVSGLRRALADLGEPLTRSASGYTLQLDPERLDVRVVERLAARAREHRGRQETEAAAGDLAEALGCWRPGAPLGGLPGPFAAQHRAWANELWLRLLVEHAELLLDLGRPGDVVDRLLADVPAHPTDERLRALLMTALHRGGRTAEALAQYHDLRRLLAEELGIDPSAELQSRYAAILADDAGNDEPADEPAAPVAERIPAPAVSAVGAPPRPAQLPRGVGDFVGRADPVERVLHASRTPGGGEDASPRIVLITGVGGVGKTALAVHCANQLAAAYPDGQLYVNLRGFDPKYPARSPADALHQLLSSLHVRTVPAAQAQRVALWRSTVRDKRLLIVLDNAESADQVDDLLPGGGPSFVVVTSRNRLSGLAVRYSASRETLSPLSDDESMELLSRSVGADRVSAEPAAAGRLAELCDHIPLALRVAAEQASVRPRASLADLVADLEDVRRRLDALEIPDDELSSVRGVLSWSYTRLDDEAAHTFRTLGTFPGVSLRPAVAGALLDVTPAEATGLLRRLTAQHLVESGGGTFWMHDLTRIYADEVSRAEEPDDARRRAIERVADWYLRTLVLGQQATRARIPFTVPEDDGHEPQHFGDQRELVAWCTQEWENLGPLLRAAQRAGLHDQVWRLAYLLWDYFYAAGQATGWVDTLRVGIHSASMVADRQAQAMLRNHLSVAYSRMGENRAAVEELEQGLRMLEDIGDDVLRTSLVGNLASTLREAEDYPAALRYARQALELAHRTGIDYYEAGSFDVLCELHAELGEYHEALRYGRPGLTMAKRCRDRLFEANILINLGVAEHGLDNTPEALRCFREALALCESGGDRYHEALALFGLARVHRDLAAPDRARDLANRALLRLTELGAEEVATVTAFLATLETGPAPTTPERQAG